MLTKDKAAEIFEQIRKHSTADEVEAMIYGGKFALTRFANNTIHQNVAEENYSVSVRTVFGGRTARATTNKFDSNSLKRVVEASESLAKVQHPDPDLLSMPGAGESPATTQARPSRHFAQTAGLTPELRADAVEKIVRVATQHKLTTAGVFSSSESVEGIFNSRELADWHTQTSS
jgi:predicted Zn-dependent protease